MESRVWLVHIQLKSYSIASVVCRIQEWFNNRFFTDVNVVLLFKYLVLSPSFRFPCGRWLGKGSDDGALERLLVAESVPPTVDANGIMLVWC